MPPEYPEQYDCFLSYRREDAAAAEAIHQRLVAAGFKVWWDLVYLKDKYNWHEEIERHCEASRVVIPLLTPEWQHSERTRYETYGAERVVPLLLRGKWKDVLTAPLARLQRELLDLKTAKTADWERLFQRIRDYRDEKRPVRGSQDRPTLMKYRPVDHFVGRDQTMVDLHEKLFSGKLTALTQQSIIAIPALGGVGKTTLARHYAEKFWRCYRQMFWVDCRTGVEAGFAEIYDLLLHLERIPRPLPAGAPQSDRARWVKHELSQPAGQQTLLILDNAEDETSILAWLPESGDCHVLITSRFTDWSAGIQQHPVWVLDPEPAREFLRKRSGRAEDPAADTVAQKLGYLPLALEQAAAYVKEQTGFGFGDYLKLYEAEEKRYLDRRVPGATSYPDSVYLTWHATVQKLPDGARAMLRLHAFFAPTPFPVSLYLAGTANIAEEMRAARPFLRRLGLFSIPPPTEQAVRDWKACLVNYSMAKADADDCISVHTLVQSVQRHALQGRAQAVARRAAQMYYSTTPEPSWGHISRGLWAKLVSHSRMLSQCPLVDDVMRLGLYRELVWVFIHSGNYGEGVDSARRALEFSEQVLGPEHPNTLTSVNNLAHMLGEQGKYDEAEPLYRRTLTVSDRVRGPDHPDTLLLASNLASLLRDQGKYDEAEPLLHRVLDARERVLGQEHPDTLISVNSLAVLLWTRGAYQEAKPLFDRSLNASERSLGWEHPDTLTSANNLAMLLESHGKYDEAEPLLRRVLDAKERVLGSEHPDTLTSANNLALLLQRQGEYDEAKSLNRRALEVSEHVLGAEHPNTLLAVSNLASLLRCQGLYDEAEPLNRRALHASERVLGPEHPNTLLAVHNLATLLQGQDKGGEAEPLQRRAFEAWERVLGPEHPNTLLAVHNLAALLQRQGHYDKAEPLNHRVLDASQRVLGPEHPNTLLAVSNLAELLLGQRKYDEAEPLCRRALEAQERVLGAEHPHTLQSVNNLAKLLLSQEKYDEAELLFRRALEARERVLGSEHRETLISMYNLARLLENQGKYKEADPLDRRALEGLLKTLGPGHPLTKACAENHQRCLRAMTSSPRE